MEPYGCGFWKEFLTFSGVLLCFDVSWLLHQLSYGLECSRDLLGSIGLAGLIQREKTMNKKNTTLSLNMLTQILAFERGLLAMSCLGIQEKRGRPG